MSDGILKEILESQQFIIKTLQQHGEQLLSLNNCVAVLEQGQQELKTDLQKLELRLENEAFYKIGTLFDGYSLRGDQIENLKKHIDERFDSIETDTRYL